MLTRRARRLVVLSAVAVAVASAPGCDSPEDGRPRGGGNGGDGGNYRRGAVHVPSKIDGTKSTDPPPKT